MLKGLRNRLNYPHEDGVDKNGSLWTWTEVLPTVSDLNIFISHLYKKIKGSKKGLSIGYQGLQCSLQSNKMTKYKVSV